MDNNFVFDTTKFVLDEVNLENLQTEKLLIQEVK